MIVKMKKATVIVQGKDKEQALAKLRSLGLLHVEHQRQPVSLNVSQAREELSVVKDALAILSSAEFAKLSLPKKAPKLKDLQFVSKHIVDSAKRIDQLEEYSRVMQEKIADWKPWGDFNPEDIKELDRENIFIKLYKVPLKEFKKIPKDLIIKKISERSGIVRCVVISRLNLELPFKELELPNISLKEMQARLSRDAKTIEAIREDIRQQTCYRAELKEVAKRLTQDLEFSLALAGMGEISDFVYLTGYFPIDAEDKLKQAQVKEGWGLILADPKDDDKVPTLVRNPKWVTLINPVFKLIEIVPGYHELDISLWFLLFFSVFFGMLIGDAGYGAIFFIFTALAQAKWGGVKERKPIFILLYVLSSFVIIWGLLTGTFFGQEWLPQVVKPLIPALRDNRNLQAFCFFLGALHLSIAHFWRAVLKAPSIIALADIGWVSILWGAFYLAKLLILGDSFPIIANWLIISGAALVVLFSAPKKNIIKGLGLGVGELFANLINSFTDIVSYIRLFAVGLATVAVADAFNKMALGIGFTNFFTSIITALILLVGHTLNILLGPLAVIVHGVRLNVLEFCSHLNITWSGFSYKPLEERA